MVEKSKSLPPSLILTETKTFHLRWMFRFPRKCRSGLYLTSSYSANFFFALFKVPFFSPFLSLPLCNLQLAASPFQPIILSYAFSEIGYAYAGEKRNPSINKNVCQQNHTFEEMFNKGTNKIWEKLFGTKTVNQSWAIHFNTCLRLARYKPFADVLKTIKKITENQLNKTQLCIDISI